MPENILKDKKAANPENLKKNSMPGGLITSIIVGVIIISVIAGGISGLFFGVWASQDNRLTDWIQDNVLKQLGVKAQTEASEKSVSQVTVEEESATIEAVEKVSPSVVSIVITQDLSKIYNMTGPEIFPFDDIFDFNSQYEIETPQGKQEVGAGTGFIITADGLILTNKHVVSTQDAEYTVVMNDGKSYAAKILDTDPFNDIALMKIEADNLPIVEIGDSDSLVIGETVIAIGNTLGQYSNTVTKGVISGLSRTIQAGDGNGLSETLEDTIQTDAAINFGNSGGPLINLLGQVVGINTAISQEGQLVGFAIPVNQAKQAIDSVKKTGKITRVYLGVRYVIINDEIAKENKLEVKYGALIVRGSGENQLAVVPGSPADKAGLVENDIILEINGQKIDSDHSLVRQLQKYSPGDQVTLKIHHKGEEKSLTATLEEYQD